MALNPRSVLARCAGDNFIPTGDNLFPRERCLGPAGWSLHSISFAVIGPQIIFLEPQSGTRHYGRQSGLCPTQIIGRPPFGLLSIVEVPLILVLRKVSPPLSSLTATPAVQSRASLARISTMPILWSRNNNQGGNDNINSKMSRSLRRETSCLLLVSGEL